MEAARRLISVVTVAAPLAACGISLAGSGTNLSTSKGDASAGDESRDGGTSRADGGMLRDDAGGSPDATNDAPGQPGTPVDGGEDAPHACTAFDAGLNGPLDLATFTMVGSASENENDDGRITLTNSTTSQAGAAWYPVPMPALGGYDLTWTLRVGPGDQAGDGITFALLAADETPGVGDPGDGLGLRGIALSDGGLLSGYAVAVDMYQDIGDPTNLGPTTLKLVTMPGFDVVAASGVPMALNDGNTYAVDVSWMAPSSLRATLRSLDGGVLTLVSSGAAGLGPPPSGRFGFTGATGGVSDSHNEVGGITVTSACE